MSEHLLYFLDKLAGRGDVFIKGWLKPGAGGPAEFTGQEAYERSCGIAAFLKDKGISKNDRVAVIAEKCPRRYLLFSASGLTAR